MDPEKKQQTNTEEQDFVSPVKDHYELMVYLMMFGVCVLFVGLSLGYVFGNNLSKWERFSIPKIFWLSTLLMIGCSWLLTQAQKAYKADDTLFLRSTLSGTLAAALGFLVCQVIGWRQLMNSGILINGEPAGSFLYVISGLHGLHILAGVGFLLFTMRSVWKGTSDQVQSLIFYTTPVRATRLRMLAFYWHVVDGLWVYLFLFFLFQHS